MGSIESLPGSDGNLKVFGESVSQELPIVTRESQTTKPRAVSVKAMRWQRTRRDNSFRGELAAR
jgi:hypothetical protein